MINKKIFAFFLFPIFCLIIFLTSLQSIVASQSPLPMYSVDNPDYYFNLLKNSDDFSEYSDFEVTGYSFNSNNAELKPVWGYVDISSDKISKYGLTYTYSLHITFDENNKVTIDDKHTRKENKDLLNQFESIKEIEAFILKFRDNNPIINGNLNNPTITSGNYRIYFNQETNKFIYYSIPLSLVDKFPDAVSFKNKVESEGCKIINDNIRANFSDNKVVTVIAEVEGSCQKSTAYSGGNSYEMKIYPPEGIEMSVCSFIDLLVSAGAVSSSRADSVRPIFGCHLSTELFIAY